MCCLLPNCPFFTQVLEHFTFFSFLTSITFCSALPIDNNVFQFLPLTLLSPNTHSQAGQVTAAPLIGTVTGIARLANPQSSRFLTPRPACRPTPVLCHSWAAQTWNLIPGGRLFYLQRKANRMGTHRSWERNISQGKHAGVWSSRMSMR